MSLRDATAVLEAFRSGDLAPQDYAAGVLERAEAARDLNAITALDSDLPGRAHAAFEADPSAPLAGLPIVVKDNIAAKGFATAAGTPALANGLAQKDAPCVAALTGAVVAGKAAMHELAFGITSNNAFTGPVRNPSDPSCIAGGSSGGTAAAIAAGIVPAGLGSDTGGSCRIPAALCGIVGFRPSSGRYDGRAIVPISRTKDTPGPMARSVRDIALLDGLMVGDGAALATPDMSQITFGVPRGYFFDGIDSAVGLATDAALGKFAAMGARLIEVDLTEYGQMNEDCGGPIALSEVMQDLPRYLREHRPDIAFETLLSQIASPDVRAVLLGHRDAPIPPEAYDRTMQVLRPKMRALYESAFENHGLDAIVMPTTPLTARPIGEDETVTVAGKSLPTFPTYIRNTDPASNIGAPSISVPLPVYGLPIGLMLEARPGLDCRLLAIAAAVEHALVS